VAAKDEEGVIREREVIVSKTMNLWRKDFMKVIIQVMV